MRYEHTPRPNVEHHHHIRDLINTQEKRAAERTYFREKEKNADERESLIREAHGMVMTDFWCDGCREDFKAQAVKQVEVDWTNPTQRIAFYTSKHWCGKNCIRLITDRYRDAFWFKSKSVRVDRARAHNDTIQPHETGFQLLYGRKNKA